MFGINDLWLFVVSGLLLNMTPGADLLYLIDRSMSQGVRYGIAAGLGASLGCIVHMCLAVLGLSAIMLASELANSEASMIALNPKTARHICTIQPKLAPSPAAIP